MVRGLAIHPDETISQAGDGPDGAGVCRRFPTQQLYSSGDLLVACDAELYNEPELLGLLDGVCTGAEDAPTAALLARLYQAVGERFIAKLRGIFSVVIIDRKQRKFVAAVDGFNVKRLAYKRSGNLILVSSRVTALARTGEGGPAVNPYAVANYINFGITLAPETILTGVQRMEPGTMVVADERSTRIDKYWDLRYYHGERADGAALSEQLRSVVAGAVSSQCKSDSFDQVGAFLSGGTDSSTIVGLMSHMGRGAVKAFSIGFEDEQFDELNFARIAARAFQAKHYTYIVSPQDCFNALPLMVRAFDEPFGNNSAIPTYYCARLAADKQVKTLIAGDGGDELFAGNERYLTDKIFGLYQRLPRLLRAALIEPGLSCIPVKNGIFGKARRYIRRSNVPNPERFFSYNFLATHNAAEVLEDGFLRAIQGRSFLEIPGRHYAAATASDDLDRLLYVDVKITLGDSDLPKVMHMSELAGVQTRFPYLDRSVAEFSGHIPPALKLKRFEKRYLFKRAFSGLLPMEIIKKKKHGFGIPVSRWLRAYAPLRELGRDVLLSRRSLERGYFRPSFLKHLFEMFERDDTTYYGDTLWSFLALELWHREVIDPAPQEAA
jgi:asparagine synthase (glutamine-hydrolysing)